MIIDPSTDILKIDACPDADFAGMCGHEKTSNPAYVKQDRICHYGCWLPHPIAVQTTD